LPKCRERVVGKMSSVTFSKLEQLDVDVMGGDPMEWDICYIFRFLWDICYIFQGGVQNGTTAIFALKNGTTAIFSFFFKYFFADLNHRTNSGIAHRSER
jgi:hypothetical protein